MPEPKAEQVGTKVIKGYPPNYDKLKNKFDLSGRSVAFTYGDTIYLPDGGQMPLDLQIHESVHAAQQRNTKPEEWWDKYLEDKDFRFKVELEAYRGQYNFAKTNYNRQQRRTLLARISKDFASAMYGKIVSKEEAKELISK